MNTIGLDISKETIDAVLEKSDGQTYHLKIRNDTQGFEELTKWMKSHKVRKAVIAMEATGIYYERAAEYLTAYQTVYVINPLRIKEYAKSRFSHTKTDKTDAALIADYAKRHQDLLTPYRPNQAADELHKLNSLKNQLKRQLQESRNRLHAATDEYIKATHQAIILLIERKISQTATRIERLIRQQNKLKAHYDNLQTVPGIGKETAAALLAHLTGKDFETANRFVAYAGLSPKIEQSGTSVDKRGRLSRYGNRRLKSALYMPAVVAYRIGAFGQLTANLAAKPKMVVIVAIMRKLAKIAYYLYKTGKPFDKTRYQTA